MDARPTSQGNRGQSVWGEQLSAQGVGRTKNTFPRRDGTFTASHQKPIERVTQVKPSYSSNQQKRGHAIGWRSNFPAGASSRWPKRNSETKEKPMLWTICVVLIILWLLGLVSGTTMGGLIHVLLVIAVIVILVQVISGRK